MNFPCVFNPLPAVLSSIPQRAGLQVPSSYSVTLWAQTGTDVASGHRRKLVSLISRPIALAAELLLILRNIHSKGKGFVWVTITILFHSWNETHVFSLFFCSAWLLGCWAVGSEEHLDCKACLCSQVLQRKSSFWGPQDRLGVNDLVAAQRTAETLNCFAGATRNLILLINMCPGPLSEPCVDNYISPFFPWVRGLPYT